MLCSGTLVDLFNRDGVRQPGKPPNNSSELTTESGTIAAAEWRPPLGAPGGSDPEPRGGFKVGNYPALLVGRRPISVAA